MENINIINSKHYQNLFLFNYMKDNETWWCDKKEDRVRYYNPLNASYLGLQFNSSEKWLQAVKQKVEEYFTSRFYDVEWSTESITNGYCALMLVHNHEYNETLEIAHIHAKTQFEAERLVLIGAVEYVTHKSN